MKKPALIFADSMSDWWSEGVKRQWRADATTAMGDAPQHRFVVLTKRPEKIGKWDIEYWPTNAWLGVSITNGEDWWRWEALERLPERIHKFISAEPLLGGGIAVRIREALKYGAPVPGWLILGPQSGPDAVKPVDTWQRLLRDECDWGAIPLFEKANLPLQPAIRQMPADLESVFRKGLL
jgi:protein gp37